MHVAVRYGGLRLEEVVREVSGLRYQAAAEAVKRFEAALTEGSASSRVCSAITTPIIDTIDATPLSFFPKAIEVGFVPQTGSVVIFVFSCLR
jgi:hypothetical protein